MDFQFARKEVVFTEGAIMVTDCSGANISNVNTTRWLKYLGSFYDLTEVLQNSLDLFRTVMDYYKVSSKAGLT